MTQVPVNHTCMHAFMHACMSTIALHNYACILMQQHVIEGMPSGTPAPFTFLSLREPHGDAAGCCAP